MNRNVIGYSATAVAALVIGAGVATVVAPNTAAGAAPPSCIRALSLADSNFTVLAGAMTSASKIVTAANSGDDAAIGVGTAEVNAAGTQMTLGSYRTARDACRALK
jgi:hypothetical protein